MPTGKKSQPELIQELAEVRAQLAARDRRCRELSHELERLRLEAPRQEESRPTMFDAMREGFGLGEVILDETGRPHDFRILEINEAGGRVLGIAPDKVRGLTARQLFPVVDPGWFDLLGDVIMTRQPVQFEKFSPALSRWFSGYAYSPEEHRLACLVIDVTDRKQAEQDIQHSQRLLAEAERLSHTGTWEWDLVSDRWKFSREWLAIHGCMKRTLDSDELMAIAHPDDRAAIVQAMADVRNGTAPYDLEHRIVRLDDGSERIVHAYGNFVRDASGTVVKVYGFTRDLTDGRRAEEKLQRLSQFPEENPNPVLRFTLGGALLYANAPARRWLSALGWEAGAPLPEPVQAAIAEAGRQERHVEVEITDRGGRTFGFFAIRPPTGEYINFYGIDITERKRTAVATERQNALLLGINRIFETVVTSASDMDFGAACLTVAEEITGSAISFLGEIGPDGLLHDLAISNPAWEACATHNRQGQRNLPGTFHIHGIYAGVLTNGTALLVNDPASHPARVGLPAGHPPLTAFLGAPLKQGDKVIGMIAVGNRPDGYLPEHQEALEVLARVIGEALLRRRTEEALRQSETRYRNLFMYSPDAIYVNQQDHLTFVNDACLRLFGARTADELIGKTPYDLIHREDHPVIRERIHRMRDLGEALPLFEKRIIRLDGSTRDVEVISAPFPFGGSNAIHVILRDITDRKRAEAALRESEARYRSLFQNNQAVMLLIDPQEGQIIDANAAACAYYGYTPEAITRLNIADINQLPSDLVRTQMQSAKSNRRHRFFFRHRLADGHVRDVEVFSSPITVAGRELLYSIIHDITDRKRAEEALRESQAKLEAALASMTDAVFISDAAGRFIDFNDAFATFHRFNSKDECVRTLTENPDILAVYLADGELAPVDQWAVSRALRGETATNAEYTLRRKDTGQTWVGSYSFSPIRDKEGVIVGSVVVARDITALKHHQMALQRSEERLKRAQEIAHLGSWELDLQQDDLTWSDEVYRILGLQPQPSGMTFEAFLSVVHPEDRPKVANAYRGSLRDRLDTYEVEHRIVRPNGEVRHVHEKCEHQRDGSGNIIRSVGMVHDITERKQTAEALERTNKELEQFAYAASHDLQEPLRSIVGFLQLLQSRHADQLDDKAQHYIARAVAAGLRMQALIRDLLSLSRVSTSSGTFMPTDLNRLVQAVLSNLESTLLDRRVTVACAELPWMSVDASQIQSLFQNLVGNAVKYNEHPHPGVEIGCRACDNGYQFFVRDNGIGISSQFHERIFRVFQRLHTEREYPGTGLGLALCKKIVERHGGTIWVDSQPRQGSTFYFTLPGTR